MQLQTLFTVLEAIEKLTLALCERQKWKEEVKVSKCRKFGDLILKTVALVKFLITENLTENVVQFCVGRAYDAPSLDPMQTPIHSVLEFRGIFFKNLTNITVFNIKSSNVRHLLTYTCSFHF